MLYRILILLCSGLLTCMVTFADTDIYQNTNTSNDDVLEKQPFEKVGQPIEAGTQSLDLDSKTLGLTGPLEVSSVYSDNFGFILTAMYTQLINPSNALSLLADLGDDENRIDATWATQVSEHQRLKLSLERLAQKLDFSYDSGDTSQWVPQYSTGLGYQYLFDQSRVHDVELSGYYARSESDTLDTIRFEQDGLLYDNYRHIAGATSQGLATTIDVTPWQTGLLGLGLNYDRVFYHNVYQDVDADDRSGLGYTVTLDQLLSKHVKLSLLGSQRETYDDFEAGVYWLLHATQSSDMELHLLGKRILGEDSSPNDTQVDLGIEYLFDGKRYDQGYQLTGVGGDDLATWSQDSLAYMDLVLAAADQKTVLVANQTPNERPGFLSDEANAVTLEAGVVNTVDLQPYLEALGVDEPESQKVRILGGPKDFGFAMDHAHTLLTTTTIVPTEDVGKTLAPMHVMWIDNTVDSSASFKAAADSGDVQDVLLNFTVAPTATTQPYPNNDFNQTQGVSPNSVFTKTFYLECPPSDQANDTCPATTDTLFINPNETNNLLYVDSSHGGSIDIPQNSGFTATPGDEASQTLVVTGQPGSGFTDPLTITVKACNKTACATGTQDIILSLGSPIINGDALPDGDTTSPYSKYTFSSEEVSPGGDNTYNTSESFANYYVNNAKVTDTNLETVFTSNSVSISSDGDLIPETYAGKTIEVELHVTNSAGDTVVSPSNDRFTIAVAGGSPLVAGGALPDATVDSTYAHTFSSDEVTPGAGSSYNTSATTVTFEDQSGNPLADTGFTYEVQADSLSISSNNVPDTYAGQTIVAAVHVENTSSPAETSDGEFTIAINSENEVTATLLCPDPDSSDDWYSGDEGDTFTVDDDQGVKHYFETTQVINYGIKGSFYLTKAKLSSSGSGYKLTCNYAFKNSDGSTYYTVATDTDKETLPSDTDGHGGDWSGNTCEPSSESNSISKCPVTFSEDV